MRCWCCGGSVQCCLAATATESPLTTVTPEQAAIMTPGHDWIIICSMQPRVQCSGPHCLVCVHRGVWVWPCRHVATSQRSARILTCSDSDPAKNFYTRREKPICALNPFPIMCIGQRPGWLGRAVASLASFLLVYYLSGILHNIRSMLMYCLF